MIDRAKLLRLHWQLLRGSRTASEEAAVILLSALTNELRAEFRHLDPAQVSDGVTDAILDYAAHPESFDPKRGIPVDRFLRHNAWRNIANTLRSEKRRRQREETAAKNAPLVELHPAAGNLLQDEITKRQQQQEHELASLAKRLDRELQKLRQSGERRTAAFAEILGISHLPVVDQRREVKRAKDRIDKILRRRAKDPQ